MLVFDSYIVHYVSSKKRKDIVVDTQQLNIKDTNPRRRLKKSQEDKWMFAVDL